MSASTTKRKRTVITNEQLHKLEEAFKADIWPGKLVKEKLAQQLNKSEHFINVWFQNRRAKWRKKESKHCREDENKPGNRTVMSRAVKSEEDSSSHDENEPKGEFKIQVEDIDDSANDGPARADDADDAAQNCAQKDVVPSTSKSRRPSPVVNNPEHEISQVESCESPKPALMKMGNPIVSGNEGHDGSNVGADDISNSTSQRQRGAKVRKITNQENTQSQRLKNVQPKPVGENYNSSPSRLIIGGSKVMKFSGPQSSVTGNQTGFSANLTSFPIGRVQASPFPMIIKTDSKINLQNVTIATTAQNASQVIMPSNQVPVLRGVTTTGATVQLQLLSIAPPNRQLVPNLASTTIQEGSPRTSTTLFHALTRMLCVAEGGIISPDNPEFDSAATDYLYGIRINEESRVVYEKYTGLSLIPLKKKLSST